MRYLHRYQRMVDALFRPHRRHLRAESAQYDQNVITSTCFWRNEAQLRVLYTRIAPTLAADTQRPLRIAVHAGSMGCEAISMRMAEKHFGFGHPSEVHSFDIDKNAIAAARRGVFSEHYFRDPGAPNRRLIPQALLRDYFHPDRDGSWRVDDQLLRSIRFEVCDMTDANALKAFGRFDLIVCQNALLHLTREAGLKSLKNLCDNLEPGGGLLLGGTHPDRLADLTSVCRLEPVPMDDLAVYESWSNRHAMWRRNPLDHLALEPYAAEHRDGVRRFSHVFVRDHELEKWLKPASLAA